MKNRNTSLLRASRKPTMREREPISLVADWPLAARRFWSSMSGADSNFSFSRSASIVAYRESELSFDDAAEMIGWSFGRSTLRMTTHTTNGPRNATRGTPSGVAIIVPITRIGMRNAAA